MGKNEYYFSDVEERAKKHVELIKNGKVRNHKLGNTSRRHTGEIEEKECTVYCDFLRTKTYDFINNLRGCDNND